MECLCQSDSSSSRKAQDVEADGFRDHISGSVLLWSVDFFGSRGVVHSTRNSYLQHSKADRLAIRHLAWRPLARSIAGDSLAWDAALRPCDLGLQLVVGLAVGVPVAAAIQPGRAKVGASGICSRHNVLMNDNYNSRPCCLIRKCYRAVCTIAPGKVS
jgi:hypothetical protein